MNNLEFVGDYRQPQLTARQRELGFDGQSSGDFTFNDFLDIINPLQHIPFVSTLYREITGDEISPHASIIGGTLFGGPSGFVSSIASALYDEIAGEEIGDTLVALFTGEDDTSDPQFAVADDLVAPAGDAQTSLTDPEMPLAAPLTTAAGPTPPAPSHGAPRRSDHLPGGPQTSHTATPEAGPAAAAGPGMLTGQDALSALFNDLRGSRQPSPSMPPASNRPDPIPLPGRQGGGAMKSFPLPPRALRAATPAPAPLPAPNAARPSEEAAADAGAAHPLVFAQDMPQAAVADRMLQALDKYGQMTRQRQTEPADGEPRWESDPTKLPAGGS